MPKQHEHKFQHLDTKYLYFSRGFGNPTYKRVDRYFCTVCCEEKEVVKEECSQYQPEWFNGKDFITVRD